MPFFSPGQGSLLALTEAWTGRMNAWVLVTGTEREPESSFSACVGGPLSTLRAEAASLLQLLIDLRSRSSTPLLVFVDCLVLLDILQRWGQASFHPHPTELYTSISSSHYSMSSGGGSAHYG